MSSFTMKHLMSGCLILLSLTKTLHSLPQVLDNTSDNKEIEVGNSSILDLNRTQEKIMQCEINKIHETFSINVTKKEIENAESNPQSLLEIIKLRVFELSGVHLSDEEISDKLLFNLVQCTQGVLIDESGPMV